MNIVQLHFISEPWRVAVFAVIAFVAAWVVSKASKQLAEWIVVRYEVRHSDDEGASTGVIIGLKRRETIVSLVQTSVRYAAYGVAIFFTVVQLAGLGNSNGALAGASLIVVLIGFALQRFLIDILTGFFMQFEGWFSIGDSITVEPYGLAGIVEETSLRSTKLRALSGELLYVHNSQLLAARVLPRGLREVSIELFLRDEERGVALFEQAARVMPIGPTEFVRPPWIESIQHLDRDLIHVRARATLAPGREWLAHEFLSDVLKERAEPGLIVHGPVVLDYDELARMRFARASAPATRSSRE
ncbi:MAG: moderate conductance mechanosensitive channel [Gaiellales bacterium]|nr:moderate conductance mechanosensitive channel [Gaiellales bacterium]MDX6565577.1 moderate conductance mechanosensitive channel [Gaiellales bacterium]